MEVILGKTAILIDGGFFRKRANTLWGVATAEDRAEQLISYCQQHLRDKDGEDKRSLYRIFYYDCPPYEGSVYHPYSQKNINLKKSVTYMWANTFLEELKKKRKVALRLGKLSAITAGYSLIPKVERELFSGKKQLSEIIDTDFVFHMDQKGVDIKIGIDIATLAYKKLVDQIILISGDSDFVPAAKLARREGIDFILDPLHANIRPDLFEHIDGLMSKSDPTRAKASIVTGKLKKKEMK